MDKDLSFLGNVNYLLQTRKVVLFLRWLTSIFFFFLGLSKAIVFIKYGNMPYLVFVQIAGLPEVLKYYGVVALGLELFLAISVWSSRAIRSAIVLMIGLSGVGVVLSLYFLVFKLNSDCGCGLLGNNEYGLLLQKLIIISMLTFLFKNREVLFLEAKE